MISVFFFSKDRVNHPNINDERKNGLSLLPDMSVRCQLKEEKHYKLSGHITRNILAAHSKICTEEPCSHVFSAVMFTETGPIERPKVYMC